MNKLICTTCQKNYSLDTPIWRCDCGGLLDIDFKSEFPIQKIEHHIPTMWRYREAIPIQNDGNIITFDEGFTPLLPVDLNGTSILIKQDHLFTTGSYKDRGASVLISKVKELGINKVVEDSSGNAGGAIAAYCAAAEIECDIYVPAGTSPAKVMQIGQYGAKLIKISGSREDTAKAVLKAAENNYFASHYWNPFFFHGTKTFAFEVCEQLGWKVPEAVILPVGNGTLLLGAYIGFNDLMNAGIIDKLPKLIAVQAANCAPIYQAFKDNLDSLPKIYAKPTIAKGIAIADPVRSKQIIDAVKKTNGDFIAVEESEIKEALINMGRKGFYIEPTSAATIAGVTKYLERSDLNELIVTTFTGHGLKSTDKILQIISNK